MEKIITTRIIKTGSSLCVVIPKKILHALKLERGDTVVFGIVNEQTLAIRKLSASDLRDIRPDNILL